MFDVLISGATVVDGSGAPGFAADVGINGEKILAIGDLSDTAAGAGRVIDATGLTVSPGFIDTHAHSDGALLLDPQHANGLRHGITTELLGQDGLSYAPLSHQDYLLCRRYLSGIYGLPGGHPNGKRRRVPGQLPLRMPPVSEAFPRAN